jgi:hypothetical protein
MSKEANEVRKYAERWKMRVQTYQSGSIDSLTKGWNIGTGDKGR